MDFEYFKALQEALEEGCRVIKVPEHSIEELNYLLEEFQYVTSDSAGEGYIQELFELRCSYRHVFVNRNCSSSFDHSFIDSIIESLSEAEMVDRDKVRIPFDFSYVRDDLEIIDELC
jgi:hypothetical protein